MDISYPEQLLFLFHRCRGMRDRISASLTLQELADYVGLSKTQFIHVFKTATGRIPIDYFLHLKMQRACQYLDLTEWGVQQIAESVGMSDPYYFSRLFRKMVGVSPKVYRMTEKGWVIGHNKIYLPLPTSLTFEY